MCNWVRLEPGQHTQVCTPIQTDLSKPADLYHKLQVSFPVLIPRHNISQIQISKRDCKSSRKFVMAGTFDNGLSITKVQRIFGG